MWILISKTLPQIHKLPLIFFRVPGQSCLSTGYQPQLFSAITHAQLLSELFYRQVLRSQCFHRNSRLRQDRQQEIHIASRLTEIQISQPLLSGHLRQLPLFVGLVQYRC